MRLPANRCSIYKKKKPRLVKNQGYKSSTIDKKISGINNLYWHRLFTTSMSGHHRSGLEFFRCFSLDVRSKRRFLLPSTSERSPGHEKLQNRLSRSVGIGISRNAAHGEVSNALGQRQRTLEISPYVLYLLQDPRSMNHRQRRQVVKLFKGTGPKSNAEAGGLDEAKNHSNHYVTGRSAAYVHPKWPLVPNVLQHRWKLWSRLQIPEYIYPRSAKLEQVGVLPDPLYRFSTNWFEMNQGCSIRMSPRIWKWQTLVRNKLP